jgi:predicted RNase H-like HicB family nuclease
MKTFTAMLHSGEADEGGFWATCLEVPGANGQGATREECLQNLAEGIKLILEIRREEAESEAPVLEECLLAVA